MDIARPDLLEKKKKRQLTWIGGGVAAVVLLTLGVSRLKPAAPTVERATVVIDTVRRGEMVREVHGLGTLVPEDIRWITALTEVTVERRVLLPGTVVKADSVILELSNPELENQAKEAESQAHASEAQLIELKVRLQSQLLVIGVAGKPRKWHRMEEGIGVLLRREEPLVRGGEPLALGID